MSTAMVLESDFRLGEWTVKPHTNTIQGPAGEAHLEPKAMQVLALLAERPGEVLSKKDILTGVWDGTFVSEEVLPNAIWELRKALGDDARKPRFIQTLPKKGYRLIVPVEPAHEDSSPAEAESGTSFSWHKWPWLLAPLLVAVLVGLAFLVGNGGDAPPSSTEGPYSLLVMNFENHTEADDLAWLSSGIPTMLRTGLAEVSGLSVVSAQHVDRLMERFDGEEDAYRGLARRTGARAVLLGSIFQLGDEYRIDVQVEDVSEARIVAALSVRGRDVFQLMDELTIRVRDSLREEEPIPSSPIPTIREMTTTSLEAYRLYNAGVTARRNLRLGDARRLLTEAVSIDPSFALAYFELQWVAMMSKDDAGYEEFHQKLLDNQSHLPPGKRVVLEAAELWDEERDRAEAMLLDLIDRLPEEEEAYMQLYHLYQKAFQLDQSLGILERGAAALPHSGYLRHTYGYALLRRGRFPEAIHEFESYARINPKEANPWDSLGEAYLIAGIPQRALEEYARALEIDPTFSSANIGRSWAFALTGDYDEALAEIERIEGDLPPGYSPVELTVMRAFLLSRVGRYQETRELLRAVEERGRTLQSTTLLVTTKLFAALIAVERDESARGLALAEEAREALDGAENGNAELSKMAHLIIGIAACRSGALELAQQHLAELARKHEPKHPRQKWWYHLLLGETLLSRGEAKAAYTAFTEGEPSHKMSFNVIDLLQNISGSLSFRDGPARALVAQGKHREGIEAYEKLLRPDIGQRFTAALEPRFHVELARLYREVGGHSQAAEHYRRFLELWSRADPSEPEVEEARAFLASL